MHVIPISYLWWQAFPVAHRRALWVSFGSLRWVLWDRAALQRTAPPALGGGAGGLRGPGRAR